MKAELIYILYLLASFSIVGWLWSIHRNAGQAFMTTIFSNSKHLSKPVNKLLSDGFFILASGIVLVLMATYKQVESWKQFLEVITQKMGGTLFGLAILHFGFIWLYFRGRRKAKKNQNQTP